MVDPLSIRVERPYANEDEFLDAEAWSVTARSVLLIDIGPLPEGTPLRFELRLANGPALIVAEGSAVKHLGASPTRPAGLVVRYKRMSAASSEFVKRAAAHTAEARTASSPIAAPSAPSATSQPPLPPPPAATVPPRRVSAPPAGPSSPPPRPSRNPTAAARPGSGGKSTNPPPRASAPPPRSGSAHSVSVVPAARRVSSIPPDVQPRRESPRSSRPSVARQSSAPGRRPSSTAPPSVASPNANSTNSGGSRRPQGKSNAPSPAENHDSAAMQRLRSRAASKAISTPPDREAILLRLKKKPHA